MREAATAAVTPLSQESAEDAKCEEKRVSAEASGNADESDDETARDADYCGLELVSLKEKGELLELISRCEAWQSAARLALRATQPPTSESLAQLLESAKALGVRLPEAALLDARAWSQVVFIFIVASAACLMLAVIQPRS